MPTWTFIRHGQSQANAEGWFAGQIDSPLTERGVEQATVAAEELKHVSFDRAFASDLSRARETARMIVAGRGLAVTSTPVLRERSCGAWERRVDIEAPDKLAVLERWDGTPPGGESLETVAKRVLPWLAEHEADGHTLVVSHGALMRAVLGVLDGRAKPEIGLWKPKNLEAVTREVPRGRWATLLAELG